MSRRRLALLKLAVTVMVVGVLAWRLDLGESAQLLGRARPGPLVMAVGLLAGSHLAVALAWRVLLEGAGVGLRVERSIRLYYAGLFLNNFFLGSVGGDTYRVLAVRSAAGSGRRALAATLMERVVSVTALLLLGLGAVACRWGELPGRYAVLLALLTGAGAAAGLAVSFLPGTLGRLFRPLLHRVPVWLGERLDGVLTGMEGASGPGVALRLLLVMLAAQGVRVWTHWWCGQAIGLEIAPMDLFVAIPLVAVAAGLPLSIGGLGVREGSGALLLAPLGVAHPEAVAMEFLAYLVGVATSLLGGLAFLLGGERPPQRDLGSGPESGRMGS
ncbi:MAG: lysylphosphatidylglycerol synthase transmembrane domain-containing protein [bacterium]